MAVYPGSRFLRGLIMPLILIVVDLILLAGMSQSLDFDYFQYPIGYLWGF